MGSLQAKITQWKIVLDKKIRAAEDDLAETVRRSATLSADELRGLLSIGDYRDLVNDLGRALRLTSRAMSGCALAAAIITRLQLALKTLTVQIWRHGGGHAAYVLIGLLEPVIFLQSLCVTVGCSRLWLKSTWWRSKVFRGACLRLSNAAFWVIVNIAVAPPMVTAFHWFHCRLLPLFSGPAELVRSLISVVFLSCRLFGASHGTVWTIIRLTLALARWSRITHTSRENDIETIVHSNSTLKMRIADVVLGRQLLGIAPKVRSEELWVDFSPDGSLFGSVSRNEIMALWERIDSMSSVNARTYEEILATFQIPASEAVAAVMQIARPPRPLLSAVIVATGLRMGIAERLAKLRLPHLRRESSRWKFFGRRADCRYTASQRYVVVTPLNNYKHQEPRITSGKLTARILEAVLGDYSDSSFEFVFVLPVCRRETVQAVERERLARLLRNTLAGTHLPVGVNVTVLDDLQTDISLPNIKGLPLIIGLRHLCATHGSEEVLVLSEMNDSASWLNIPHLAAALPPRGPVLVTGRRPILGAGKPVAGHAATRLFNFIFRFLVPNVTVRDSSAVLKAMTVSSMRAIIDDLTCLDYSIDQDVLAMMAARGRVIEKPIEWYQARGRWGHERPASAQISALIGLARKARLKRSLANLRASEWLVLDTGFDFKAMINARGEVLKGHAVERNRLSLLISALRSVTNRSTNEREGHREYAALIPVATRLISVVGQGPLKALLRVVEGRYRDPLPSIREHLKYRVPAIVETTLVWRPSVNTPIGPSTPFLFALKQPFATLGTLRSAMEWNMRSGDVNGAADALRVILGLQDSLLAHGLVDPDMKSLLDCGVFIENNSIVVKHLDFAGFLRDPYVIAAVLPGLMNKVESMRDFRQIARWLKKTTEGRAYVVKFRGELDALTQAVQGRLASGSKIEFAAHAVPDPLPLHCAQKCHVNDGLVDDVIATAKFATHAPIGSREFQILMRQAVGNESVASPAGQNRVSIATSTSGASVPEPIFVVSRPEVGVAIDRAMCEFLPGRRYEVVFSLTPSALPLTKLLRDAADGGDGARVVMRLSGLSSRMRHLRDGGTFHKALIPVWGRPLFVHALEALRIPASWYPNRVWLTHPDTICIWGHGAKVPNPEADFVVPLPSEAFQLLRSYKNYPSSVSPKTDAIGKLFARYRLTLRTGGYSLPSLIGVKKSTLRDLDDSPSFRETGEADFWGHLSRVFALPERHRSGRVATPMPQVWFDIDEPSQLMAFYRHAVVPGFTQWFGVTTAPAPSNWENCVNIQSSIDTTRAGSQIHFRSCVFDNSEVIVDLHPGVTHAVIEGLVVANSNVRINIAAPTVRNILISGVTTPPDRAVVLALDGQAIACAPNAVPASVPLTLRSFSSDGRYNELLRCPVESIAPAERLSSET